MSLKIRIKRSDTSASLDDSLTHPPKPTSIKRKSSKRRVASDSDYEEEPEATPSQRPVPKMRKPSKSVSSTKPRVGKERDEDSPIPVRDERKSSLSKARENDRVGQPSGSKRSRADSPPVDVEVMDIDVDVLADGSETTTSRAHSGPPSNVADLFKEDAAPNPSPLPSFKKRQGNKMPPMKKHKPDVGGGTSGQAGPTKPKPKVFESKVAAAVIEATRDDGLSHLVKPTRPVKKVEVDLMDKDVYAALFKQGPGASAPRSGVNLKEKEERRRELDKMREEDRSRRAAAANVFDLRSQHDKIVNFAERMNARRGFQLWPNILAVAFRQEHENTRKSREQTRKQREALENGEVAEDGAL